MIHLKTILLEVTTSDFINRLKSWENSIRSGWNSKKKKWFPHTSLEGGTPTIAYGHKLSSADQYKDGIDDKQAVELLKTDINRSIDKIKNTLRITNFDTLPTAVRQAIVNATFRGELKATHQTVEYMRRGQWEKVATEYLNNKEYRTTPHSGIKTRMEWNAQQFRNYATSLKIPETLTKIDKTKTSLLPIGSVAPKQEVTIKLDNSILPINKIVLTIFSITGQEIKKHQWVDIKRGLLQFPAPANIGVYTLRLNNSATHKLVVS